MKHRGTSRLESLVYSSVEARRIACGDCPAGLQGGQDQIAEEAGERKGKKSSNILSHWSNFSFEFFPVVINTW